MNDSGVRKQKSFLGKSRKSRSNQPQNILLERIPSIEATTAVTKIQLLNGNTEELIIKRKCAFPRGKKEKS